VSSYRASTGSAKDIADAPLRPNDVRRAGLGFQFAPQSQHLHVDTSVEDVFVHTRVAWRSCSRVSGR